MISVSASQLATILGAKLVGDGSVSVTGSAETDSRLVSSGSIFFAKLGEQADGHD
jgi:UDP-N-acetylmuramoyl-tripeptide--D-alanyl-D-alanine ligase